jgi:hypothetical protein
MKTIRTLLLLVLVYSLSNCSKNKDDNPMPQTHLYPVVFTSNWGNYTLTYNTDKKLSKIQIFWGEILDKEINIAYSNGNISTKTTIYFDAGGGSSAMLLS